MTVRASLAVVGLASLLFPRLAHACPMCASQQPGGVARVVALGVMIVLPFAVAFVVFRSLRRGSAPASSVGSPSVGGGGAGSEPSRQLREQRP